MLWINSPVCPEVHKVFMKSESIRTLFFQLTLYLELFTHIVPVPLMIYFTMVTGGIRETHLLIRVAIAGTIAGVAMVTWGVIWRYFAIRPLVKLEEKMSLPGENPSDRNEEILRELKSRLLRHPFRETRMIFLRWIIGVPTAHLLYLSVAPPHWGSHMTIPFLLVMIIPISVMAFLFISENIIRPVLKSGELADVFVDIASIPRLDYSRRIIYVLFSLVLLPSILLGYLLFTVVNKTIVLENIGLHIGIIASLLVIPITMASLHIARALRVGMEDINGVLSELEKGNLSVRSIPATADDFGMEAVYLGKVIDNLREIYQEIKDLNENLELKVLERTSELNESLEKVSRLQEQSLGDYYLISLLSTPLSGNQVKSPHLSVEYILKQKKQFEFRKNTRELGGDLCSANTIILRDRSYTVFLNADAMGKSMQGAGGILVLGSVFQSILERTRLIPSERENFPEFWIKNVFLEVHKVFETFKGSMLISIFLGMVDDETGLLYYVNAEHPYPILCRDKKSRFLDAEHVLRKIGMMGLAGNLSVQTFLLYPGDVVFVGSDGKDDVKLPDENGEMVMNDDEFRVLKIIENSGGELEAIVNHYESNYALTDDFSLMKISFHPSEKFCARRRGEPLTESHRKDLSRAGFALRSGNYKDARDIYRKLAAEISWNMELFQSIAYYYFRYKKYTKASHVAERILERRPDSVDAMTFAALCLEKAGDYQKAAVYRERLRIWNPTDQKNLYLAIRIYRKAGNKKRAIHLSENLERIATGLMNKKIYYFKNKLT